MSDKLKLNEKMTVANRDLLRPLEGAVIYVQLPGLKPATARIGKVTEDTTEIVIIKPSAPKSFGEA